eukprot:555485-Prymnesium_polylepis.1
MATRLQPSSRSQRRGRHTKICSPSGAPSGRETLTITEPRGLSGWRAARDFQAALTSLSNYKQKSWYTHATVWIAWQQVFDYGNTWPLSTISIESRNARIKKYGRRFTNWRPLVEGFISYSYKDRRSQVHVTSQRRHNSSAVHQLLQRVALSESSWHAGNKFTAPDKLRLQTHTAKLRRT